MARGKNAMVKHDIVVEINAHPWRIDLDWRFHQAALEFGCMLSINPDAHSVPELDHMHWGVEMARKGGVPPDRVLNAMTLPEITRYLRQSGAHSRGRPERTAQGRDRGMVFAAVDWWRIRICTTADPPLFLASVRRQPHPVRRYMVSAASSSPRSKADVGCDIGTFCAIAARTEVKRLCHPKLLSNSKQYSWRRIVLKKSASLMRCVTFVSM